MQADRQAYIHIYIHTYRQTSGRGADIQTCGHTHTHTYRQTTHRHIHTGRHIHGDRQADSLPPRQAYIQAARDTHTPRQRQTYRHHTGRQIEHADVGPNTDTHAHSDRQSDSNIQSEAGRQPYRQTA